MTTIIPILIKVFTNKWTYVALGAAAIIFLTWRVQVLTAENSRLDHNYDVMRGKYEAEIIVTKRELKDIIKLDSTIRTALYDSLDLKAREVERLQKINAATKGQVSGVLTDTVIYYVPTTDVDISTPPELEPIKVKAFQYNDEWTSIFAIVNADSIEIKYEFYDNLVIVQSTKRVGKFLPRIFGRRVTNVDIVNSNPNAVYTIEKQIKMRK